MKGFGGEPNELLLVKYLLRHGYVMETLNIIVKKQMGHGDTESNSRLWAEMLQYYARASSGLQILISSMGSRISNQLLILFAQSCYCNFFMNFLDIFKYILDDRFLDKQINKAFVHLLMLLKSLRTTYSSYYRCETMDQYTNPKRIMISIPLFKLFQLFSRSLKVIFHIHISLIY